MAPWWYVELQILSLVLCIILVFYYSYLNKQWRIFEIINCEKQPGNPEFKDDCTEYTQTVLIP